MLLKTHTHKEVNIIFIFPQMLIGGVSQKPREIHQIPFRKDVCTENCTDSNKYNRNCTVESIVIYNNWLR